MNNLKLKCVIKITPLVLGEGVPLFIIYKEYIYREREREIGYGALQSTKALCALRSIFNFKSEIIDPYRSI
jgi:hypothetical protein